MNELKTLAAWNVRFSHKLDEKSYRVNETRMVITDGVERAAQLATAGFKSVLVENINRHGPIVGHVNIVLDPLLIAQVHQA